MIIRPAKISDRPAVFAMARAQAARYPKLRVDVEKLHATVSLIIGNSRHFSQVIEVDNEVKGTILCVTSEGLWAQRKNSQIALWVSEVPGGGVRLLRSFKKWIKSSRAVKMAGMCPDLDLDERTLRIAELTGFERHGGSYLLYN